MRMLHAARTWRRAGAALLALTLATPLPGAAAWFDGDEKRLAAEADRFVADKPAELQRILHTLYMEGEWNAVLNLDLLGLAAIEAGRPRLAERAFDMAAARILRIYADDPNARQARSLWSAESVKDWKGEPYERAMTFYYRGLLYPTRQCSSAPPPAASRVPRCCKAARATARWPGAASIPPSTGSTAAWPTPRLGRRNRSKPGANAPTRRAQRAARAAVRAVALKTRSGYASLILSTVGALLAVLLDFARGTHTMPRRQPLELADLEKKQKCRREN